MIRRLPFRACLLLALLAAAVLPVYAKDSVQGMSERVFKAMTAIQVEIDAENLAGARTMLEELLTARRLSTYERAHTLNLLAYTWYSEGDYVRARQQYAAALALDNIPDSMRITLTLALGQVSLVQEDYPAAEGYLRDLLLLPDQDLPVNRVLLAASLMGQERYGDAVVEVKGAIAREIAAGGQAREQWLSMLASAYYELEDYTAMRDVVNTLATQYPREQYFLNLAALHGQLGETGRQLALIESLLDDGRLSKATHMRMAANLFLAEELPYKAAALLQREVDSGNLEANQRTLELLSQAWYLAAETQRAIPPLERAAALADNGEVYMRLARLQMDSAEWKKAEEAARLAIRKGGLREEGHAWLVRGMAKVRLEAFREADEFFMRAANFDHTERYATQWLAYIDSERQRIEALKDRRGS